MNYLDCKKYISRIICLLLLGLIAACDTTVVCIEPDDFGYTGYSTVPSKPDTTNIHPPYVEGKSFVAEYADWVDTGYVTDGNPIVVVVENNWDNLSDYNNQNNSNLGQCIDINSSTSYSLCANYAWTAWFGSFQSSNSGNSAYGDFSFPLCQPSSNWCALDKNGNSVINMPCTFTQGVGAYALLMPNSPKIDPNLTNGFVYPSWNLYNLAAQGPAGVSPLYNGNNNSALFDAGCQAGGLYLSEPPSNCQSSGGCSLYVKILDQLYEDNFGGYSLAVKSGFGTAPGVLSGLVDLVTSTLAASTENIYTNLIPTLGYIRFVLISYIIFIGIGFLIGSIEMTQKELVIRILKIALVLQVATSETSWNFFNNYFFQIFTGGVDEITGMLAFGSNNADGFAKLDQILNEFFSLKTFYKVSAIIFTNVSGFFFFFIFYFVAVIAAYAAVRATIMYIVCYTVISTLIIVAPIFIPFILFEKTKHFFSEWLKYLMSFFIQPIIIIAFAFFICEFVLNQMYYILGIRVCWTFITRIFLGWDLYLWKPAPIVSSSTSQILPAPCISAPGRVCGEASTSNSIPSSFSGECSTPPSGVNVYNCDATGYKMCGPYECVANRNPDVPYLDPNYPPDIEKWTELLSGTYINFSDLMTFAVLGWLMLKLIEVVPNIAKTLAGTPMMMTDIATAGGGVIDNAFSAAKYVVNSAAKQVRRVSNAGIAAFSARKGGVISAMKSGVSAAYNTKDRDIIAAASDKVTKFQERIQDNVGGTIEYLRDKAKENIEKMPIKLEDITTKLGSNTALFAARAGIRAVLKVPYLLSGFNKNVDKKVNDAASYFIGEYKREPGWLSLPKFKKPEAFKNALRDLGSRSAMRFGMPVVSGLMHSLADTIDGDKKGYRENVFETYQDKVGGLLDNFFESKFAKYSHAVYNLTGGNFGTDANAPLGDDHDYIGMSRADYIRAQHETNLDNWEHGLMGNPDDYKWVLPRKMAQAASGAKNYLLREATNQSLNELPMLNRVSRALGHREIDDDHPSVK